jgi:hypothetical protein
LLDAFCYFLICDSHNLIFCTVKEHFETL